MSAEEPTCHWTQDKFDDFYDSDCNHCYCFDYEFHVDGAYTYCPGCGRRIELVLRKEEPIEE